MEGEGAFGILLRLGERRASRDAAGKVGKRNVEFSAGLPADEGDERARRQHGARRATGASPTLDAPNLEAPIFPRRRAIAADARRIAHLDCTARRAAGQRWAV
jgi:hypothetical protein